MKSRTWLLGWIVCLIGAGLIALGALSLFQQLRSGEEVFLPPALESLDASLEESATYKEEAEAAAQDATTVKVASVDTTIGVPAAVAPAADVEAPLQQAAVTPEPVSTSAPAAAAPDATTIVQQFLEKFPIPEQIWIDKIKVRARVEPVGPGKRVSDQAVEWEAPKNKNVGWHDYSGRLGEGKNIVLNGHNNIYGAVFRNLYRLEPGDEIRLGAKGQTYVYKVEQVLRLLEKGQPLSVRLKNAEYIQPMNDDRLTIVSCWPPTNNTHRVIVIARPVAQTH